MSSMMYGRARGTWTEEAYFALPETSDKIELFDGELFVAPRPNFEHQRLSLHLAHTLQAAAASVGLEVYQDVQVHLRTGRIAVPDIVVIDPVDEELSTAEVTAVHLALEIVSPGNARMDRVQKMNKYADAGIPTYILVDRYPELAVRHFQLDGNKYVERGRATIGAVLRLTEPFVVEIDTSRLGRTRVR
jgi:Uma2 family endonuclease